MNNAKLCRNLLIAAVLIIGIAFGTGCGGGTGSAKTASSQGLIDPSGNWQLRFTDTNNNLFLLSALFNQTGAVVSGVNLFELGNGPGAVPPTPFQCIAQRDISLANGLVANVSNFTGDISGNFGSIHFNTTLNNAGTEAVGTYSLVPGAAGNCLNIALNGVLTADEVPSVSGTWTGSITCFLTCPTGTTTGTIVMTLSQDDATGTVTGSYAITGIPGISSGIIISDVNDFLSGPNVQEKLQDNNGSFLFFTGGPVTARALAGFKLDRTFQGQIADGNSFDPVFEVNMSH
jgi:hypothetical protein